MGGGRLGYATNASDQAFFTSAVCNTRLRERSVNRVLSAIRAWFDGLATIPSNVHRAPNFAEFRRKIYA
ncbi:MAG: hypothetical protein ACFNVQ_00535 [Campylobacter sp.]